MVLELKIMINIVILKNQNGITVKIFRKKVNELIIIVYIQMMFECY